MKKTINTLQNKIYSQSAKMYGASSLIYGYDTRKKILSASWVHGMGFVFSGFNSPYTIIHQNEIDYPTHLIANDNQLQIPKMEQYNAIAVGVPFIYTNPEEYSNNKARENRVYFPTHSTASLVSDDINESIYYKAKKYECNAICLNSVDYDRTILTGKISPNINILRGADSTDENALLNMRNILLNCTQIVTESSGSHIFYAAICGCKVEIHPQDLPLTTIKEKTAAITNAYPIQFRKDIEQYVESSLSGSILKNIAKMSKKELLEFSKEEAGYNSKKTKEQIIKLLEPENNRKKLHLLQINLKKKITNIFIN